MGLAQRFQKNQGGVKAGNAFEDAHIQTPVRKRGFGTEKNASALAGMVHDRRHVYLRKEDLFPSVCYKPHRVISAAKS